MKRVLTAVVLVPLIVYAVLFANFWIFFAVLLAIGFLCYREYDGIAADFGFGAPGPLGYAAGVAVLLWDRNGLLIVVGVLLCALSLGLRSSDLSKSLPRTALLLTGVVYVFGCFGFAVSLREVNPHWLMYALLLNWVGDTGAFLIGRKFGKHKLAPQVSPKKSWEGAIAAVVFAVLAAGGYLLWFLPEVPIWEIVVLTAVANVAGQVGDLAESAMKRGAGVKDSGTILPGHGGFLDRVDSTLFALPVIYAWIVLVR
jgi:phosphatidate cytidylyltransferase